MPPSFPLSDQEVRSLLGSFTHDLRNPLSAIVSNLDFASRMAAQDNLDPDLTEALTDSVSACDLLRRILANLDIIAAEGQNTHRETTAIGPAVADAVRHCAAQADQAGISLTVTGGDDATKVAIDRSSFSLGVENLIANSLVHAPQGSEVKVTVERVDQNLRVHVEDRGPAIPAELQDLATSPEGQTAGGRKPGSRYARGAALLAARAIADMCGGSLQLGAGGEGSQLTLALPIATSG